MQMGSNWVCILNRKQVETTHFLTALHSRSWKLEETKTWKCSHNLRRQSQFCVYESCFETLCVLLRWQPVPFSGFQLEELWAETKPCSPEDPYFWNFVEEYMNPQIIKFLDKGPTWECCISLTLYEITNHHDNSSQQCFLRTSYHLQLQNNLLNISIITLMKTD